ncbi:Calx-beta domain-containing protein [Candidatus Poriferisodalis sp.]|uniref:Calx-beta domain-containing protein n=1 Tax=Candidatus Poriferisodalis sp. TaxID=3101277 RepID=UPI003B022A9A
MSPPGSTFSKWAIAAHTPSFTQASEGDGIIEFEITLTSASTSAITVDYATFDGTATQPEDYTAASGTVTIPANATRATITITLTDDSFGERDSSGSPDETFLVRLTDPVGAELGVAEGTGVITDDDDLPFAVIASRIDGEQLALRDFVG